ncbi:hypothetical protein LCGC14_1338380 [marine sediment metagenome]|uniref:Uncharacterized protein n=1 Tax=marine sediment metagenome TaxID=412755 RepID=A0A0F9KF51_9ZZZZ
MGIFKRKEKKVKLKEIFRLSPFNNESIDNDIWDINVDVVLLRENEDLLKKIVEKDHIMEGKDQRIKELEKLVEEQKKVLGKTHKVFLRGTCGTTEVEINVKNKSVKVNSEDESTEVGLLCDNTEPIRIGDIFMCPNPEGKDQFLEK